MTTETQTQHTPGPWHMSKCGDDVSIYAEHESAWTLATVRNGGTRDFEPTARLIAAAPDLYEALQALSTEVPVCKSVISGCTHRACAAVNKAKEALAAARWG